LQKFNLKITWCRKQDLGNSSVNQHIYHEFQVFYVIYIGRTASVLSNGFC